MKDKQRRPLESISQWRNRLILNNRRKALNYQGELEPATVIAEDPGKSISQGTRLLGRKSNNYRVGQKSLFGQRKNRDTNTLGRRILSWFTDKTHLTSPPTYTDGYGTTRNAEVPYLESAQGKQDMRMLSSLGKLGMAVGFAANPLASAFGLASGVGGMYAARGALNTFDNILGKYNLAVDPNARNATEMLAGLATGGYGSRLGMKVPVKFDARTVIDGLKNTQLKGRLLSSDYVPRRWELYKDRFGQFFRKLRFNLFKPNTIETSNLNYLGGGVESKVYDNGPTVIKHHLKTIDSSAPFFYAKDNISSTVESARALGKNIVTEANRGIYKMPSKELEPVQVPYGYYPRSAQPKTIMANDVDASTVNIPELTRFLMNTQRTYNDGHFGNIGFDSQGHSWLIDATKLLSGQTGNLWGPLIPRESLQMFP